MSRIALRVLSALRWPNTAVGALVLGMALISSHSNFRFVAPLGPVLVRVDFDKGAIHALWLGPEIERKDSPWVCRFIPRELAKDGELDFVNGWWEWLYKGSRPHFLGPEYVRFPAWCVFAPLGAFAALGFRAKRRLAIPAGACPNCRHALAGAATCPECGTRATL